MYERQYTESVEGRVTGLFFGTCMAHNKYNVLQELKNWDACNAIDVENIVIQN